LQHFLRPAAKEIGVYTQGFGFHSFRREAKTEYGKRLGAAQVQRMMGHSKADMSQHYELSDREAQEAAVRDFQAKMRGTAAQVTTDAPLPPAATAPAAPVRSEMVGSTELESVTSCVSSRRSNQLSYEPVTRLIVPNFCS
jgi:hypothetical protein